MKQRDWLTSEALPVLRSTIVEDIQRSWYSAENEYRKQKSMERQSSRGVDTSGIGKDIPVLEKTESQKMRLTAIWTNRFKKVARLYKLQFYVKKLDAATEVLMPFKKRQMWLMILAEIVALSCILVPAVFEMYNNNSIRATAELRIFQEAGDRVKYYDEVLTMSARLCVLRGDEGGWSERYNSFVGPMDVLLGVPLPDGSVKMGRVEEIENVLLNDYNTGHDSSSVGHISKEYASRSATANSALIDLEAAALEVCHLKNSASGTDQTAYTTGKNKLFDSNYQGYKDTLY